eukprot:9647746-Karenia_brevis.AAC.1
MRRKRLAAEEEVTKLKAQRLAAGSGGGEGLNESGGGRTGDDGDTPMDATGASSKQGKQGTDLPTGNISAGAAGGLGACNWEGIRSNPAAEQPTPPGSSNMPQAVAPGQQPGSKSGNKAE